MPEHHDPASYPQVEPFKLDRPSTIDDVCDFIVEYINSDVVVRDPFFSFLNVARALKNEL